MMGTRTLNSPFLRSNAGLLLRNNARLPVHSAVLHADSSRVLHIFRTGLIAILVALSYYAGTKLGFALTPAYRPISGFWPPNAILLAALLLAPRRMWGLLLLA